MELPENDEGAAWRKRKDEGRFLSARNGDMLMIPFQCEWCWLTNIKRKDPDQNAHVDRNAAVYIRRFNLDMMWSREKATVSSNLTAYKKYCAILESWQMDPENLSRGPFPVADECGVRTAITMLRQSQMPGKNSKDHQQFDSIRKLRTVLFHVNQSSQAENMNQLNFLGDGGKSFRVNESGTQSLAFLQFIKGLEKRMGRTVKQDTPLSIQILGEILMSLDKTLSQEDSPEWAKRRAIMLGSYLVFGFCAALRGGEGLLCEATTLCALISEGIDFSTPFVLIPLMGRFKNEVGERNVLLPLVATTQSGIPVRKWANRLVHVLESEGRNVGPLGPAFCKSSNGFVMTQRDMNALFHGELEKIQERRRDLIPSKIDVCEHWNVYRSMRRGATVRATELKFGETAIDMNNRWRKGQAISRKKNLKMREIYLDIKCTINTHLSFSAKL